MKNTQESDAKNNGDRRRLWFWKLVQPLVWLWVRLKFNFSHDDFDPSDIKGPVIVCINHASAYDPIFVGLAFRKRPLTFVASEHLMRSKWGPFLDRYLRIIPHQKGAKGTRTALIMLKRIRKGQSIFLAPEGEQTWNGQPMPVMPFTGKMIKSSGATLVNYRIEGAYLSAPRWSFATRKCKVYGYAAGVYGPEVLNDMSAEDVEALIARDLAFDVWEWQKSQPDGPLRYKCSKGGNADGLERFLFSCPACGSTGTLISAGDHISCSCGFRLNLDDSGFFEKKDRPITDGSADYAPSMNSDDASGGMNDCLSTVTGEINTVCDWEDIDNNRLLEILLGSVADKPVSDPDKPAAYHRTKRPDEPWQETIFSDDGITLVRITDGHSEELLAQGCMVLERCFHAEQHADGNSDDTLSKACSFVLSIGSHRFDMAGISNMTMVLAARIVFSDKYGYYELRSKKGSRTNLRKYAAAFELLHKYAAAPSED